MSGFLSKDRSSLWLAYAILAFAAFVSVFDSRSTTASTKTDRIAYSDFIAKVNEGSV